MISFKNIYEAELLNGEIIKNDDENIILLIPELMDQNLSKIIDYYKNYLSNMQLINIVDSKLYLKKRQTIGVLNEKFKIITPFVYDKIYEFKEGLARVRKGKLYGFIDENGKEVIPCQYGDAYDFEDGIAKVSYYGEDKYFLIDKTGKQITKTKYYNNFDFREG